MQMPYTFQKSDGGRSTDTKRRVHTKDCMVRALSLATGVPYSQVFDELIEEGVFTPNDGGYFDRFVGQLNYADKSFHGFRFEWVAFRAKKGEPRMNPDTFAERYPEGNFILRMSRHYVSMIDGTLRDIFVHTSMRCVYGAWHVVKEGA